jgi:hypothetical protein
MSIREEFLSKIVSRKLTVWIGTTVALYEGLITSKEWVIVTVAYVLSQAVSDIFSKCKEKESTKDANDND